MSDMDALSIDVQPGTYVLAVSGGVDSMALLDILRQDPKLKLIIAHYDHGIRHDSRIDRELVQATAKKHQLPFVYHEGNLGPDSSEDMARKSRYEFLHAVRKASNAKAIITAHHHDDVLETAIINLLRGTGRKGLSSLGNKQTIHRPALHISKQQLKQYAQDQGLLWREDATNEDTRYLRNKVRHDILSKFSPEHTQTLIDIVNNAARTNKELDTQLMHYLHIQPSHDTLHRGDFIRLPHSVAREVLAAWLRKHNLRDFDQKTLERLVVAAKTYAVGKRADILRGHLLLISQDHLALIRPDR